MMLTILVAALLIIPVGLINVLALLPFAHCGRAGDSQNASLRRQMRGYLVGAGAVWNN